MCAIIVKFEDWEKVLRNTVPVELQAGYREAVVKFRYWLGRKGKAASVEAFKEHLAWKQSYLSPAEFAVRREALRWYYDKGRKLPATAGPAVGMNDDSGATGKAVVGGVSSSRPPREGWASPGALDAHSAGGPRALTMNDVPSLGKADWGGPPWERGLCA